MSQNFHEEEQLSKSYDSNLMKRLLGYAVPFWRTIACCILLMFVLTAADLARPYLIKVAIDSHMSNFNATFIPGSPESAAAASFVFRGVPLVKEPANTDPSVLANVPHYHIEHIDHGYRMVIVKGIGASAQTESIPMTAQEAADLKQNDVNALIQIGVLYFAIIILSFGLNYLQTLLLQITSQRIIYNIRQQVFSYLQRLPLAFFDKNPVGRLVTRVMNDTETLNEMYTQMLVTIFKDIFILIGIVIVMLQLNWRVAIFAFASIPFILLSTMIYRLYARNAFREVRTRLARINATLAENISGMRVIQIFNREHQMEGDFRQINSDHLSASWKELRSFAIFRPTMDLIYQFTLAGLIWYGGNHVLNQTLEFGVLYAFISYIQQFFQPIQDLSEKYNTLQSAMASSERIFLLLDTPDSIPNSAVPQSLPQPISGSIEFQNVWFAYQDEDWVLRDVSFTVKPGETVAFVGATGAGKSSILSLISRFYDVQKGRILVEGIDIRNLSKEELRQNIGIVLQDVFLFTGSVKDNIRLNEISITDEQIQQAAAYVNADTFISKLPSVYDEPVQERGVTFSAGQRQLLAFARALAFDPAILVLDEATANIDTETEVLIQDALVKLTRNRTTLIVAHRLSTIQHADKIIVLHKGKIRELGTHQELLNKRGMYYNLYQLQYKDQLIDSRTYASS